jgi:CheY-like chemotaxis protein/HPt (histidine-containing phosphotransfer) domain-containing protein
MHDVATRGKPFDVVLLDHSLPDATTEQLLRTIRLDPAIADTYVVLMSALDFNPSYEGNAARSLRTCASRNRYGQQLLRGALQASRLPRKEFVPPPEPSQRQATVERDTLPVLGLHVLVVDDNAINREVAVAMLEELRCNVDVAEDGRVAVAKAAIQRFDVILMDCQMPGMDGYAATQAIRSDERARALTATTILALTANVLARDRDKCVAAGMDAFLAKPFKSAQLLEVLRPIADSSTVPSAAPEEIAVAPLEAPASIAEAPSPPLALTDAEVDGLFDAPAANAAPISRLPVLDLEQVQAIRGLGKPLVFERLCEMLFSSSQDAFARLDTALAEGNLEEVAAAAHAFRSPVSNLGGRRLADLLERCETAALEGADLATVRRAATGLKPHYAALVAALEVETRRGTGTG